MLRKCFRENLSFMYMSITSLRHRHNLITTKDSDENLTLRAIIALEFFRRRFSRIKDTQTTIRFG